MAKKSDVATKISNFLANAHESSKCPFLSRWILPEMEKIVKTSSRIVQRKGAPKTGLRPMVQGKRFLALLRIRSGCSLKDFSEAFDISYGVVRLWNREPRVKEKIREYMLLFVADYVQELLIRYERYLEKLNPEHYAEDACEKANTKVNELLFEAKHYNPTLQDMILNHLLDKTKTMPDDQKFGFQVSLFRLIDIILDHDIYNPPRNRAVYKEHIKKRGRLIYLITESLVSNLKEYIENGDTKLALRVVDTISQSALQEIETSTELSISVLYKGKKKETIHFGKEKTAN